tara:strand:+ start:386 stop:556 length:171 start_codon:yes stop_codon:yes gene_type:complete
MQICLGMMQMSPKVFWDLAPREMYAAIKGFQKFHGSEPQRPMTNDELEKLMELYPD